MIDRQALEAALCQAEPAELLAAGLEITGRGAAAMAHQRAPAAQLGRKVSVTEAAKRLGCSKEWIYHNQDDLPWVSRLGRKVVVDLAGAEAWMQAGHSEG